MKTQFKPEHVIEIIDENTVSCAKVYCVLTKELSKKRKPTESVPSLKDIAQQYKLQVRSIKKALSYLISKDFISPEDLPSNWELESKCEITKDVQKVINIVTEAAINAEETNSVDGAAIAKVKTVTDIRIMKKVYCLISYILSNSYLDEKIVAKLDKDWFRKPFSKTQYKDQLKFNREWKKKQQELQNEKAVEQTKTTEKEAIEVDAEYLGEADKETQKRLLNKQNNKPLSKKDKYFQESKNSLYSGGLRR